MLGFVGHKNTIEHTKHYAIRMNDDGNQYEENTISRCVKNAAGNESATSCCVENAARNDSATSCCDEDAAASESAT